MALDSNSERRGTAPRYGEFTLESAGQDQALRVVDHLHPECIPSSFTSRYVG